MAIGGINDEQVSVAAEIGQRRIRLRELGKPLLLLPGRQDMTFPADLVAPTTELIPSARGVVLEQAGHMAHVDRADAWLSAVGTFLDDEDNQPEVTTHR